MPRTEVTGNQVKDESLTHLDIGPAAVRGSDANGGSQREIEQGTVSDVDLRDDAVTPAKLADTGNFEVGTLSFNAGSASNPSLRFKTDSNTGIFSPGADIFAISTGTTEGLRIDASQNVGLGGSTVTDAILSLNTTTKAFLPPRLTETQRDNISTPTAGMMIYNTTSDTINIYTTSWGEVAATETDPFSIHLNGDNSPTAAIDWNKQELQQVVIHQLASDPGSPAEGQIWYNTTTKQWVGYNGTNNVVLG